MLFEKHFNLREAQVVQDIAVVELEDVANVEEGKHETKAWKRKSLFYRKSSHFNWISNVWVAT